MKYRKKPIVVAAFQMTEERGSDNSEWPEWLHRAWQKDWMEPGALYISGHSPRVFSIRTLEDTHVVTWDDWIIQGVQGELYPCKPDIFEATYEELSQCSTS